MSHRGPHCQDEEEAEVVAEPRTHGSCQRFWSVLREKLSCLGGQQHLFNITSLTEMCRSHVPLSLCPIKGGSQSCTPQNARHTLINQLINYLINSQNIGGVKGPSSVWEDVWFNKVKGESLVCGSIFMIILQRKIWRAPSLNGHFHLIMNGCPQFIQN